MTINKTVHNLSNAESTYIRIIKVSVIALCVFVFILFRKTDQRATESINKNIATILRNEISVSNSYAISKSLVDFETIDLFNCAKLIEVSNAGRVYYDSLSAQNCGEVLRLIKSNEKIILTGLNGNKYELEYYASPNIFALLFEVLLYIVLIVSYILLPGFFRKIINKNYIKLQALEIEKTMLLNQAKQISHDVASPLSAIKMVIGLLKNIDPEVKEILTNSVKRTQMIFDDLKNSKIDLAPVNIQACVKEIISEKKILWHGSCEISLDDTGLKNPHISAQETELKRIISNILNNSYEAFGDIENKKIAIRLENQNEMLQLLISDNGAGIPAHILEKIGTRGFSHGKEKHATAGSGLGTHHAIETITSWGGTFKIASQLGSGTQVFIEYKEFKACF